MKLIKRLIKLITPKSISIQELTPERKGEGIHTVTMKLINSKGTFSLLTWTNENGQMYLTPHHSQVTDEVNKLFTERDTKTPWSMDEVIAKVKRLPYKGLRVSLMRTDYI